MVRDKNIPTRRILKFDGAKTMTDCEDCLEYQFLTVLKQNAEYLKSIAESLKILAEKPVQGITLEVSPDLLTPQEED